MILSDMEREIILTTGSAMFGPPGKEELRSGENHVKRTMGLGWLIYAFTRVAYPKTVVEIGSGGSTACILWGMKHNGIGHLHTCDVFLSDDDDIVHYPETYERDANGKTLNHNHAEIIRWLKKWGMTDICTIHHESSKDFVPRWNQPLDMVVVDGDHTKSFLENDVSLLNFLRPGGYALFHDFLSCLYEVGATLRDWVNSSDEWSLMVEPSHLSMGIIQRKFYCHPKYMMMAGELTHGARNPNYIKTPLQFTDPRACGCIKPWEGRWFPDTGAEWHSWQKEGEALAQKIVEYERETGRIVQDPKEVEG